MSSTITRQLARMLASSVVLSFGSAANMQMVNAASRPTLPLPFCTAGCKRLRALAFTIVVMKRGSVVQALEIAHSSSVRIPLVSSVDAMDSRICWKSSCDSSFWHTTSMLAPERSACAITYVSSFFGKAAMTLIIATSVSLVSADCHASFSYSR